MQCIHCKHIWNIKGNARVVCNKFYQILCLVDIDVDACWGYQRPPRGLSAFPGSPQGAHLTISDKYVKKLYFGIPHQTNLLHRWFYIMLL